jgi:NADP-dependent 3-hydroxy acid dehydrogenase YdfG
MNEPIQTIVITGAGSGLGAAMAGRFARAGYAVGIADIKPERAERVLAGIVDGGGSGFSLGMDVTSEADWQALHACVEREWGQLDVLVNNAGVAAAGRLEETPLDDWRWVLDTDLYSVVLGCHRFLPMMKTRGSGHIVNVASIAGMTPVPEVSAYATAKAAVVALSEQLRVDLVGSGLGVSVVCPALVQTALLDTFRSADERHRTRADRWMQKSDVSAEDVAEAVYRAVVQDRFLVLTHDKTRWLWRFRRWAPERYFRHMVKAVERRRSKAR